MKDLVSSLLGESHESLFQGVVVEPEILEWLRTNRWQDVSWGNDGGPSWLSPGEDMILMVFEADPQKRENPEWERFQLSQAQDGCISNDGWHLSTESWPEVQAEVARRSRPQA